MAKFILPNKYCSSKLDCISRTFTSFFFVSPINLSYSLPACISYSHALSLSYTHFLSHTRSPCHLLPLSVYHHVCPSLYFFTYISSYIKHSLFLCLSLINTHFYSLWVCQLSLSFRFTHTQSLFFSQTRTLGQNNLKLSCAFLSSHLSFNWSKKHHLFADFFRGLKTTAYNLNLQR